jgi:hypothetical protein
MATSVTDSTMRPAQIDYLVRKVSAPKYKFMKIPLNNFPSASAPMDPSSSVTLEFKCPVRVYNLARSYLSYNINAPAVAAQQAVTWEDIFDLGSSVTFGGAGGQDLMNLQYAQNYTKIARKIGTPLEDFLGNDNITGLYKCADKAANTVPGGGNGAYIGSDSYFEPQYCAIGPVNNVQNRWRQYPLGAFVGTILGVDRDFYSPVEQYLRITTATGNKTCFTCTSGNIPTFTAPTVTAGLTCNQIYLYLCVEQNPEIIASIVSTTQAGAMRYRIPYTTGFRNVGGPANGQTNIQIQLSQQYGLRLKRMLHSVYNPVEQLNTSFDCNNLNGIKTLQYQTFLDSMPLQDRFLSCLSPSGMMINQDDWAENKKYLDTRSCYTSKEMYALNWFHIDSWSEPLDTDGADLPDVNKDEGLVMDTSKQWVFSSTAGATAGLIHYTFAEFSREVIITPDGPKWVSG